MTFDGRWRHGEKEVYIKLKLSPESPLLIQAPEEEGKNNTIESLKYITKGNKEMYYIPGGSIKGVFRARAEKILYHLLNVDPSSDDEKKKAGSADKFYSNLNPINQLFGHQVFRGRITIDDAIFEGDAVKKDSRTNVAIDRFRGGSKDGALFQTEFLTGGEAVTTVRLKNPESWQIVLLCLLIRDLQEGYITVGAKSGIGFGELKVELMEFAIHVYNHEILQIKEWQDLLEKGSKKPGVYPIYTFDNLDTVAVSLEPFWLGFLEKANKKEGVSAG